MRRLVALALLAALTGCAKHYSPDSISDPYGFFSGLWHGWVTPYSVTANVVSWCLSLLGLDVLSDVQIVGQPNTGFGYWAGFVFGVLSYGGAKRR